MASNTILDEEEDRKTNLNGSAEEMIDTARDAAKSAIPEETSEPAPAPVAKPNFTTDEMVGHFRNGTDYSMDEVNAMSDAEYDLYVKTADEYYKAHPTPEMQRQKLQERLALSDELEKKAAFVAEHTDGDDDFKADHDNAAYSADYLKNHKTTFAKMDDATVDVVKNDIERMYKAASDRRNFFRKGLDALVRGHGDIGAMAYKGLVALGADKVDSDFNMEGAEAIGEQQKLDEIDNPRAVGSIRDIHSLGDAIVYGMESGLENAERIGVTAAAAVGGAMLAPAVGLSATAGSIIAGAAGGLMMNTGEAVGDQMDEMRADKDMRFSRGLAIGQGIGYSLAESTIGVVPFLGKLWSGALKMAGKELGKKGVVSLTRDLISRGTLKGLAKGIAIEAGGEAIEEPFQSQVIGRGRRWIQTGSPLRKGESAEDAMWEALDEAAGGASAALLFGVPGASVSSANSRRVQRIANDTLSVLKNEETFKQMDPLTKMLVTKRTANDSLLATTGIYSDEQKAQMVDENKDIDDYIDDLTKSGSEAKRAIGNVTKQYLGMLNSNYAKMPIESAVAIGSQSGISGRVNAGNFKSEGVENYDDGSSAETFTDAATGIQMAHYTKADGTDGGYEVINSTDRKMPICPNTFADAQSAIAFANQLDVYNQVRDKQVESKKQVIANVFKSMFGERGPQLVFVDRPDATMTGLNAGVAGYNPKNNTVAVVTDKIESLGQLYTVLGHERSHEDIAESIIQHAVATGGATEEELKNIRAERTRRFGNVKGAKAELENGTFQLSGVKDEAEALGKIGEEMVVERMSVNDLVKNLRSMDRAAPDAFVSWVANKIGIKMASDMGLNPASITAGDVAREVQELSDRNYFGFHADVVAAPKTEEVKPDAPMAAKIAERKAEEGVNRVEAAPVAPAASAETVEATPVAAENVASEATTAAPTEEAKPTETPKEPVAAEEKDPQYDFAAETADEQITEQGYTYVEEEFVDRYAKSHPELVVGSRMEDGSVRFSKPKVEETKHETPAQTEPVAENAVKATETPVPEAATTETKNEQSETPSAPAASTEDSEAKVETPVAEVPKTETPKAEEPAKPVAAEPTKTESVPVVEVKPAEPVVKVEPEKTESVTHDENPAPQEPTQSEKSTEVDNVVDKPNEESDTFSDDDLSDKPVAELSTSQKNYVDKAIDRMQKNRRVTRVGVRYSKDGKYAVISYSLASGQDGTRVVNLEEADTRKKRVTDAYSKMAADSGDVLTTLDTEGWGAKEAVKVNPGQNALKVGDRLTKQEIDGGEYNAKFVVKDAEDNNLGTVNWVVDRISDNGSLVVVKPGKSDAEMAAAEIRDPTKGSNGRTKRLIMSSDFIKWAEEALTDKRHTVTSLKSFIESFQTAEKNIYDTLTYTKKGGKEKFDKMIERAWNRVAELQAEVRANRGNNFGNGAFDEKDILDMIKWWKEYDPASYASSYLSGIINESGKLGSIFRGVPQVSWIRHDYDPEVYWKTSDLDEVIPASELFAVTLDKYWLHPVYHAKKDDNAKFWFRFLFGVSPSKAEDLVNSYNFVESIDIRTFLTEEMGYDDDASYDKSLKIDPGVIIKAIINDFGKLQEKWRRFKKGENEEEERLKYEEQERKRIESEEKEALRLQEMADRDQFDDDYYGAFAFVEKFNGASSEIQAFKPSELSKREKNELIYFDHRNDVPFFFQSYDAKTGELTVLDLEEYNDGFYDNSADVRKFVVTGDSIREVENGRKDEAGTLDDVDGDAQGAREEYSDAEAARIAEELDAAEIAAERQDMERAEKSANGSPDMMEKTAPERVKAVENAIRDSGLGDVMFKGDSGAESAAELREKEKVRVRALGRAIARDDDDSLAAYGELYRLYRMGESVKGGIPNWLRVRGIPEGSIEHLADKVWENVEKTMSVAARDMGAMSAIDASAVIGNASKVRDEERSKRNKLWESVSPETIIGRQVDSVVREYYRSGESLGERGWSKNDTTLDQAIEDDEGDKMSRLEAMSQEDVSGDTGLYEYIRKGKAKELASNDLIDMSLEMSDDRAEMLMAWRDALVHTQNILEKERHDKEKDRKVRADNLNNQTLAYAAASVNKPVGVFVHELRALVDEMREYFGRGHGTYVTKPFYKSTRMLTEAVDIPYTVDELEDMMIEDGRNDMAFCVELAEGGLTNDVIARELNDYNKANIEKAWKRDPAKARRMTKTASDVRTQLGLARRLYGWKDMREVRGNVNQQRMDIEAGETTSAVEIKDFATSKLNMGLSEDKVANMVRQKYGLGEMEAKNAVSKAKYAMTRKPKVKSNVEQTDMFAGLTNEVERKRPLAYHEQHAIIRKAVEDGKSNGEIVSLIGDDWTLDAKAVAEDADRIRERNAARAEKAERKAEEKAAKMEAKRKAEEEALKKVRTYKVGEVNLIPVSDDKGVAVPKEWSGSRERELAYRLVRTAVMNGANRTETVNNVSTRSKVTREEVDRLYDELLRKGRDQYANDIYAMVRGGLSDDSIVKSSVKKYGVAESVIRNEIESARDRVRVENAEAKRSELKSAEIDKRTRDNSRGVEVDENGNVKDYDLFAEQDKKLANEEKRKSEDRTVNVLMDFYGKDKEKVRKELEKRGYAKKRIDDMMRRRAVRNGEVAEFDSDSWFKSVGGKRMTEDQKIANDLFGDLMRKTTVTPEQDAAYADAVKRGDKETALRMIRETAAKAMPNTKVLDKDGLPMVVYHGTTFEGSVFDPNKAGTVLRSDYGKGVYFAPQSDDAKWYAENNDYISSLSYAVLDKEADRDHLSATIRDDVIYSLKHGHRGVLSENAGIAFPSNLPIDNEYVIREKQILKEVDKLNWYYNDVFLNGLTSKDLNGKNQDDAKTIEEREKPFVDHISKNKRRVVSAFVDLTNPLFVNEEEWDLGDDEFADSVDGVVVLNQDGSIQQVVSYFPSQIKSAEITYDDAGNLIPLSERFNRKNDSIMYKTILGEHAAESDPELKASLVKAKNMLGDRKWHELSREEKLKIKNATGWERNSITGNWHTIGPDFDIEKIKKFADSMMVIKKHLDEHGKIDLKDVYNATEVFNDAIPEFIKKAYGIRRIGIKYESAPMYWGGTYNYNLNTITIPFYKYVRKNGEVNIEQLKNAVMHEVQHAIQYRELALDHNRELNKGNKTLLMEQEAVRTATADGSGLLEDNLIDPYQLKMYGYNVPTINRSEYNDELDKAISYYQDVVVNAKNLLSDKDKRERSLTNLKATLGGKFNDMSDIEFIDYLNSLIQQNERYIEDAKYDRNHIPFYKENKVIADMMYKTEASASDLNYIFGAEESQIAHGFDYDKSKINPSKKDVELDRIADVHIKDPMYRDYLIQRAHRGDAMNDEEMRELCLIERDMMANLVNQRRGMNALNGKNMSQLEEDASAALERLAVAFYRARHEAGASLRQLQRGASLDAMRDLSVYLMSEAKARMAKLGIEGDVPQGAKDMIERQAKELAKKNGEIAEANRKIAELIAKADKIAAELEIERARGGEAHPFRMSAETAKKFGEMTGITFDAESLDADEALASEYGIMSGEAMSKSGDGSSNASVLNDSKRQAFATLVTKANGNFDTVASFVEKRYGAKAAADFAEFRSEIKKPTLVLTSETARENEKKRRIKTHRDKFAKRKRTMNDIPDGATLEEMKERLARDLKSAKEAQKDYADNPTERDKALGRYLRRFMEVQVAENPSLTNDEVMQKVLEEANKIAPDSDFTIQDVARILSGAKGFDPATRSEIDKRLTVLKKALKTAREGKIEEAAKIAGMSLRTEAQMLQDIENQLMAELDKLNRERDEILANPLPDEKEQVERINELRERIKEAVDLMRGMRDERKADEKKDFYIGVLEKRLKKMKDAISLAKEQIKMMDALSPDAERARRRLERLRTEQSYISAELRGVKRELNVMRSLQRQIDECKRRIEDKDFEPAPKRVKPRIESYSDTVKRKMRERDEMRKRFKNQRDSYQYKKLSAPVRVMKDLLSILGETKALAGSLDLSSMFRQGGQLTWAHPILFSKNFRNTLRVLRDEKAARDMMDEIRHRENWKYYEIAGIDFTDWNVDAVNADDRFILKYYSKLTNNKLTRNIIECSERAFSMYLNLMRADVFDAMVSCSTFGDPSKMSVRQLQAVGNYINVASQRGAFDSNSKFQSAIRNAIPAANYWLWSPRNIWSRFQFIKNTASLAASYAGLGTNPYGDKTVRRLFAKELVRYAAGVGVGILFAKTMADLLRPSDEPPEDIVLDPRSSDFLKVKIGKTHCDFLSGLSQILVFAARMATGEMMRSNGEVKTANRGELIGKFIRSKFSPGFAIIYDDLITRESFDRQDVTYLNPLKKDNEEIGAVRHFAEQTFPLTIKDLVEEADYNGMPRALITWLFTVVGIGTQTYDPNTYKNLSGDYRFFKKEWLAANETERERLETYHPMLKNMDAIEAHIKRVSALKSALKKAGGNDKRLEELLADEQKRAINAMMCVKNPDTIR